MGLDITAYRNLKPAPDAEIDSDGNAVDYDKFYVAHPVSVAWAEEHFPGRSEGVTPGIAYSFDDSLRFRAGSYGGYNDWRSELDALADLPDDATEGPFYELINFADNEGVIGPVVAAKLAKDFAAYADQVGAEGWFAGLFLLWKKAFEMAADNGAVDFH